MMNITNDKTMYNVPDTTLIQVDFGAIGDLLKVRFEVDGAVQNYEGKVFGGDMRLLKDNSLQAQLIGDFSDSGVFPLIYNANKKEVTNCLSGQAILEGFSVLQDIWDKHVGSVETAGNVIFAADQQKLKT
ncbi:unnamed protein product [Strongylus vulgaris]|uniref:Uncharacterized protein n=1 Tax=Strongylus vulgaris TaxID=40348 RepID=A0A3P7K8K7_STRVU|nr:unnamed protein product [Strongylus vulgaris]